MKVCPLSGMMGRMNLRRDSSCIKKINKIYICSTFEAKKPKTKTKLQDHQILPERGFLSQGGTSSPTHRNPEILYSPITLPPSPQQTSCVVSCHFLSCLPLVLGAHVRPAVLKPQQRVQEAFPPPALPTDGPAHNKGTHTSPTVGVPGIPPPPPLQIGCHIGQSQLARGHGVHPRGCIHGQSPRWILPANIVTSPSVVTVVPGVRCRALNPAHDGVCFITNWLPWDIRKPFG